MHDFLANNRDELVARCKTKVATRPERHATEDQLKNGISLFLEQLTRTLLAERRDECTTSLRISGPSGGGPAASSEIGVGATAHGKTLLELGYTVDQVVHDYGDLCQAITELALERDAPFAVTEFRTLNRCLDNAIADAVTAFSQQRDAVRADACAAEASERLAFLLHELRNALHTGNLAVLAMQHGNLPLAGATGTVLKRSLASMKFLVDGSLTELRTTSNSIPRTRLSVSTLIRDVCVDAQLEAAARGCLLVVEPVDPVIHVDANRELLQGALSNLIGNAFKFTHPHTVVSLRAHGSSGRVRIAVEDRCGGLPKDHAQKIFTPFTQLGADKTGLGLGLAIARNSVESMGGTISVENLPGVGCIFTVELPISGDPCETSTAQP